MKKGIVIYQAKSGAIELRGDFGKETMWASLDQIADLFGRDKSVISRHIKNIFKDGELQRDSVVAFFATTAADGKTYNVEYFDFDMILSVGYRVNSKTATRFRQWATKTPSRTHREGLYHQPVPHREELRRVPRVGRECEENMKNVNLHDIMLQINE